MSQSVFANSLKKSKELYLPSLRLIIANMLVLLKTLKMYIPICMSLVLLSLTLSRTVIWLFCILFIVRAERMMNLIPNSSHMEYWLTLLLFQLAPKSVKNQRILTLLPIISTNHINFARIFWELHHFRNYRLLLVLVIQISNLWHLSLKPWMIKSHSFLTKAWKI